MSDEGNAKGWWHTLPGIITAATAPIVGINQTGWFGGQGAPAADPVRRQAAVRHRTRRKSASRVERKAAYRVAS
jgi:hypothetical protein